MDPSTTPLLDLDRLAQAKTELEPFHFLVVPGLLRREAIDAVIADFPKIEGPRNHKVGSAPHGPAFERLLQELASPELARLLGEKLGYPGLEKLPQNVSIRTECEASDGNVHTDHWSKCVTLLVYPNHGWDAEGGRLRFLRSKDVDDFAAEVAPSDGTMVAFRRDDRSFHGHLPHVGTRRVVQVSWLQSSRLARLAQGVARRTTHAIKRLGLHPDH
ncbi:MAG: 2OG-Fe(II) oxygenase [Myxococcota bacterium]